MAATKSMLRSIKNVANGYTPVQIMVRNATSNDSSGPTVSQMADITNHTYDRGEFLEVMDIMDRRLNDKGKYWRHVAKSLTLLEYLLRYGSEDVVLWAKDNVYVIKTLREFQATDSTGQDQGAIIRVKAREITDLLSDDARLQQERTVALNKAGRQGRSRRGPPSSGDSRDAGGADDADLQRAIEESRVTAEEEDARRRRNSDESLERAIKLSLEEEEMRKKKQNFLDLDDDDVPPTVMGYYTGVPQQQQVGQLIGYDMFGNPVYSNQALATGYLQNAYQNASAAQQAQQQQLQQQQLAQQQYLAQQQQLYQQQLYQQQLQQQATAAAAAQQQSSPSAAGSNNPFALSSRPSQPEAQPVNPIRPPQPVQPVQAPVAPTLTGNQKMNQQYAELNQLLAEGTGIDTFGNEGDQRIPAQHTKTGTFVNSYGTGFKQESGSTGNPFSGGSQFGGVPNTIVAAPTGYGFGNQPPPQQAPQQQTKNSNSLIDL